MNNQELFQKFVCPIPSSKLERLATAEAMYELEQFINTHEGELTASYLQLKFESTFKRVYTEFSVLVKDHEEQVEFIQTLIENGVEFKPEPKSQFTDSSDNQDWLKYAPPEVYRKHLADSEIMYGKHLEYVNTMDELFISHQQEQQEIAAESPLHYSREDKELEYNYQKLRSKFDQGFDSHKQLYQTCAGILFGANHTDKKGLKTENIWYGIKLKEKHRKELLAEYHDIANQFKAEKKAKATEVQSLIDRLTALEQPNEESIKENFEADEAEALIAHAWKVKKETSKALLRYDIYKALQKVSKS